MDRTGIFDLLAPYSPKDAGNYFACRCPRCGQDAFCYPEAGWYSVIICNHRNSCGFHERVIDHFKIKPTNGISPKWDTKDQLEYIKGHGLDPSGLIESGLIGQDGEGKFTIALKAREGAIHYLRLTWKPADNKYRWMAKGVNQQILDGCYFPVLHKWQVELGMGVLYCMGGPWDLLKGITDGLACTSPIFGEGCMPKSEQDFEIFIPYSTIKIVPQVDTAGYNAGSKLARVLTEKFPQKQIEFIHLPFLPGAGGNGKDYCDFRLGRTLEDFLKLEGVPAKVKKTRAECEQEKFQKEKAEKDKQAEALKLKIVQRIQIKPEHAYIITDKEIWEEVIIENKLLQQTYTEYHKICDDPVQVVERLEDIGAEECLVKLSWNGKEKIFHQETLLTKNFDHLVRAGIRILAPNQGKMAEYFLAAIGQQNMTKSFSSRNGWQKEGHFVLGNLLIKKDAMEEIAHAQDGPALGSHGSEEEWKRIVVRFSNDPQVQIVCGASTIAPAIDMLGIENTIVQLWQDSSCGKSFLARLAASFWGKYEDDTGRGIVRSWSSTYVGHEFYFHTMKNVPCFLDESQLCNNKETIEKIVYQFGNGYGKSRGTKEGGLAELKSWKTNLIGTGETRITDSSIMAGLAARIIEIFRKKFEEITETEFRKANLTLKAHYGWGGPKIIQYILTHKTNLEEKFLSLLSELENNLKLKVAIEGNDLAKRLLPRWAAIMLGAQINHTLFGLEYNGKAIWQEMLESLGAIEDKPTKSIYDTILEIYLSNKCRFNRRNKGTTVIDEITKDETWGFYDVESEIVYFFPKILRREIAKRGFSWSQISLLKKDEQLVAELGQKTETRQYYLGTRLRFVAIRILG